MSWRTVVALPMKYFILNYYQKNDHALAAALAL